MPHVGHLLHMHGSSLFVPLWTPPSVKGPLYPPLLQAEGPKKAYFETHVDPASIKSRNGGAHFAYLSNLLKKNEGGSGFMVGSQLSIAGVWGGEPRPL